MRKWGLVITACYALILLGFLLPVFVILLEPPSNGNSTFQTILNGYREPGFWIPFAILVSAQALLLFLSVDTSFKRLRPRAHILVSCAAAGFLMFVLTASAIFSLGVGVFGDKFGSGSSASDVAVLALCVGLWLLWGILFYFYFRNSSALVNRLLSWLLKGSVLELLIAVPCHIIVRRRHECSAPIVTSFGIVAGLAIMLLAFGPSVLFLYKKRLDSYSSRPSA